MLAANAYRIRYATADDADALTLLAEQSSQRPLGGPVLIAQIDGTPAAALSISDGRVVTDPSRRSDRLVAAMRVRAVAIRAFETTPSLRERLLAALPAYRDAIVVSASVSPNGPAGHAPVRIAA